jgi:hypothetical protein
MSDTYRLKTKNVVLMKDDVGRAKPSIYDLPPDTHAYGRSEIPDLEGAREVTMCWAAHVPRAKPVPNGQDFKMINKHGAKSGACNAKQLKEFRMQHDFPNIPQAAAGGLAHVIPSDVIPEFAYGIKNRPSTPINDIVGGGYAKEFEDAANLIYEQRLGMSGGPGKTKIKLTKASSSRIKDARALRKMDPTDVPEEWKMSKFKKVTGKMSMEEMGRKPVTLPPIGKSASAPNL